MNVLGDRATGEVFVRREWRRPGSFLSADGSAATADHADPVTGGRGLYRGGRSDLTARATVSRASPSSAAIGSCDNPSVSCMSATLDCEANPTLENEATGSCWLVFRVLGSDAGQAVDAAVA